jgi:hypothetical protein
MVRKVSLALVALVVFGTPALAADGGHRHSGRVVDVRPGGKLVLEEMGPWHGEGTGVTRRTIEVTPGTKVQEIQAKGTWDPNDVAPGYDVRPFDLKQVKPGDFVTVITSDDRQAAALDVVRPGGAESGLASPQSELRR